MSERPPGPPAPPLVPGHMGAPTYEECARMLFTLGISEVTGAGLPPSVAFKIGPWKRRLREWGRGEIDRGNLGRLIAAMGVK